MIRSKSIAMLHAILSPEGVQYYSFNSLWGPGKMMASMALEFPRLFIWPGLYDRVPADFSSFLNELASSIADATFYLWRRYSNAVWHCGIIDFPEGDDPDGSA